MQSVANSSYFHGKSPFEMKVRPTVEPKNVKVTGPGVSSKGIPASIPADFVVDTTEAGYGDLQVQVLVSSPLCPLFAFSI
jgi:hypothetical protein